ncbi:MAG: adenylate/guanylate cyclase domain-containing protein [Chloroflexaceae bacterium]|nr:adenylate/guanylate cyclase domain-containing protein [Chloroflexaceae bacterium]
MTHREQIFTWEWQLESEPEQIWPLISDANRFNRDIGFPDIEELEITADGHKLYRYRTDTPGMEIVWEEETYEWIEPFYQRNVHRFRSGIWAYGEAVVQLTPRLPSGSHLIYTFRMIPSNLLGLVYTPLQMRLVNGAKMDQVVRRYDLIAQVRGIQHATAAAQFVAGGQERLAQLSERLLARVPAPALVELLINFVSTASEYDLVRVRPYKLADLWQQPRRTVLELFLHATRIGMFQLQWEMLCPMCRNAQEHRSTLHDVAQEGHCDFCEVDFTVNFDQSVELVFRLDPQIRATPDQKFCTGGPQFTPHILMQHIIQPGAEFGWQPLLLEYGRYRLRSFRKTGALMVTVSDAGTTRTTLALPDTEWQFAPLELAPQPILMLRNVGASAQTVLFERMAWSDQSVTAAEVTALQTFRDLFSREALRPDEQISVGTLTIMFTDLRQSTALYQEIGDAPAFGLVMRHFDLLREIIREEGGAIVKTIGDAVMAVFRAPDAALRAGARMQSALAQPTDPQQRVLMLRVGIHTGACIAVNLNDRLDYFGSTVNMAARLTGLSSGSDLVISGMLYREPTVQAWLAASGAQAEAFPATLRGFEGQAFQLWRVVAPAPMQAVP